MPATRPRTPRVTSTSPTTRATTSWSSAPPAPASALGEPTARRRPVGSATATATAPSPTPTASRWEPTPISTGAPPVRLSTWPIPTTTASRSSPPPAPGSPRWAPREPTPCPVPSSSSAGWPWTPTAIVWGADLWGNRVEEFTRSPSGYTYAVTIPNPVVPPGDTSTSIYNQVRGISFDSSGDVVSMDTVNQRVVVMSSTGTLLGDLRPARLHQHRGLQLAARRRRRPGHRGLLDRRHQAERPPDPPASQRQLHRRGRVRHGGPLGR